MANFEKLKIGAFVLDPSRNLLIGVEGESSLEPKMVDVLLALAAQPGQLLSRDQLIDAVWKTEFGADERLTRVISMLRKAFRDERRTPGYIETVSKRGYRLVAPVDEVRDEVSAAVDRVEPATADLDSASLGEAGGSMPTTPRWWQKWQGYALVSAGLAALGAAGMTAAFWSRPEPVSSVHAQEVVELRPLQVIDGRSGLDAFARQLDASLKRILSSNHVLVVERATKPELSARRESEFFLVGTLEQTGDRYNVTLYFDDQQDGLTLWSRRFTRAIADGEDLREEIGAVAAYVIACGLEKRFAAPIKPTSEVFKIYLECCNPDLYWDDGSERLDLAQRLMRLAPNDAYGYGLAAFGNAELSSRPDVDPDQAEVYRATARKFAAQALELDPFNSLAPVAKALILSPLERWRQMSAHEHQLGVDYLATKKYRTQTLRSTGRLALARENAEQAAAVNPLSPKHKTLWAVMYMYEGDPEKVDRLLGETLALWPEYRTALWYRLVNASFYGDPEKALTLVDQSSRALDWAPEQTECWRTFLQARAGGSDPGDGVAVRGACHDPRNNQDYTARMLSALGDVDGTYGYLQGHNWDWDGATIFLFYPEMAPFRNDARFMPLIAESGLLEFWTETGHWPDFCSDKTLSYDCKAEAARALATKRAAQGTGTTVVQ